MPILLVLLLVGCTPAVDTAAPADPGTVLTTVTEGTPGSTAPNPQTNATTPPGTTAVVDTAVGLPANCSPPDLQDTAGFGICEWAANIPGFLDVYQVLGDGKTLFCHDSGGQTWVLTDATHASCMAHIGHSCDIFPSTGC